MECIAKGKVTKRYEFGSKAGLVTSAKSNWILGAIAFHGNPYDGHTLKESLNQSEKIIGRKIIQATCDKGYRGNNYDGDARIIITDGRKKRITRAVKKWMRRRNAIEPVIGHSKSEHRLERNKLKGQLGDHLNVMMSSCGFNIKKLLRAFWLFILDQMTMLFNIKYCFKLI